MLFLASDKYFLANRVAILYLLPSISLSLLRLVFPINMIMGINTNGMLNKHQNLKVLKKTRSFMDINFVEVLIYLN